MSVGKNDPHWSFIREIVIKALGKVCMKCGTTNFLNNPLQVDHVVPKSKNPQRTYDVLNLQVLCRDCNRLKGSVCEVDYRTEDDVFKIRKEINKVGREKLPTVAQDQTVFKNRGRCKNIEKNNKAVCFNVKAVYKAFKYNCHSVVGTHQFFLRGIRTMGGVKDIVDFEPVTRKWWINGKYIGKRVGLLAKYLHKKHILKLNVLHN